jgi:hypothetical protein
VYKSFIRIRIKRDTRALNRSDLLEHRGWIRRIPNPDDRRSTLIEITPDGRAAADQLLHGIRTLEKSILSALSYEEPAHLLDLLAKILTRAAEVATEQPEPLAGQRIRPARLGGVPQHS